MAEKEKLKQYLDYKHIAKNKFYRITGLSNGFLDSGSTLGVDKLKIIIENFPDLSMTWLILDEGEMITAPHTVIDNNSGAIIQGDNKNSPISIDNRQYYSDSPDVLRAQIDLLDIRIKEKDAQIKEKDAQIKEKDAQIKEKDAQINRLLEILGR